MVVLPLQTLSNKSFSQGSSFSIYIQFFRSGFPGVSVVKYPPTKQETQALSLGQENPLEKQMATHSILAGRTPWTEKPGELQPVGSQELEKEVLENLKIYYKEELFSFRIQGFTLHSKAKFKNSSKYRFCSFQLHREEGRGKSPVSLMAEDG